ncbi:MAG: hypothetical protein H0W48_13910 [Methylibium sp.]|nr:hypothetical protein [Methylibium sp.]
MDQSPNVRSLVGSRANSVTSEAAAADKQLQTILQTISGPLVKLLTRDVARRLFKVSSTFGTGVGAVTARMLR